MMAMQVLLASCPRQWATPRLCLLGSAGLRSDFMLQNCKTQGFFHREELHSGLSRAGQQLTWPSRKSLDHSPCASRRRQETWGNTMCQTSLPCFLLEKSAFEESRLHFEGNKGRYDVSTQFGSVRLVEVRRMFNPKYLWKPGWKDYGPIVSKDEHGRTQSSPVLGTCFQKPSTMWSLLFQGIPSCIKLTRPCFLSAKISASQTSQAFARALHNSQDPEGNASMRCWRTRRSFAANGWSGSRENTVDIVFISKTGRR